MSKSLSTLFVLSLLVMISCHRNGVDPNAIIQRVSEQNIADDRLEVFEYECHLSGSTVTLTGATTSQKTLDAVKQELNKNGYQMKDEMTKLPDTASLEGKEYGVVDVSVCNLRSTNDFTAELWLQGLLGMPVHLMQHETWYRVQTPDDYIAWVHPVGITPMTKAEYDAWNAAEKVVVTEHYGFTFKLPDVHSQHVSDVVAGDRLKFSGESGDFYKVTYPNGRVAFIGKDIAKRETEWRASLKQDPQSIIATAETLMGIPYMWGANSSKAADCSGFVRTVFFIHDIIVPRDASQMARVGERIEIADQCSNLQPGDLIFFGERGKDGAKDHVAHVALYMGNQRFIHSQGDVHESSFNPKDANYDAYNLGRRLYAGRLLPYLNKQKEINTTLTNPYYNK